MFCHLIPWNHISNLNACESAIMTTLPPRVPRSTSLAASRPQANPVQLPAINFFLDPSIIPSLPPPGGSVGHYELMGRAPMIGTSSLEAGVARFDERSRRAEHRPGLIKRSSSFEDRPRGNRAGVGAGARFGMDYSVSTSNSDGNLNLSHDPIGSGFDRMRDARAGVDTAVGLTRARAGIGRGHGRMWSNSTAETIVNTRSRQGSFDTAISVTPPSTVSSEDCIDLGSKETDHTKISKLLTTLQALTPPSRAPTPAPPAPHTALLHPSTLITPLAIILEALVAERETLKGTHTSSAPRLPLLRDGSSFQLEIEEGGLDWRVTKTYILALGMIMNAVLPLLQSHKSQSAVDELSKTVRVYVVKMKKIFGEIAGMTIDGYGFMKGWWDESGMKGAAGEVGRWGDLFGA